MLCKFVAFLYSNDNVVISLHCRNLNAPYTKFSVNFNPFFFSCRTNRGMSWFSFYRLKFLCQLVYNSRSISNRWNCKTFKFSAIENHNCSWTTNRFIGVACSFFSRTNEFRRFLWILVSVLYNLLTTRLVWLWAITLCIYFAKNILFQLKFVSTKQTQWSKQYNSVLLISHAFSAFFNHNNMPNSTLNIFEYSQYLATLISSNELSGVFIVCARKNNKRFEFGFFSSPHYNHDYGSRHNKFLWPIIKQQQNYM